MANENLVKTPERRVKRESLGTRNRLTVKGKDPNYEYRFVNDTEDRINEHIDRGWVPDVDENVRVGGERLEEAKGIGKVRRVSVGRGVYSVLMKIKKEWFDEDQAAKQEYVKKTEEAMRPNPNDGTYGKVDITHK